MQYAKILSLPIITPFVCHHSFHPCYFFHQCLSFATAPCLFIVNSTHHSYDLSPPPLPPLALALLINTRPYSSSPLFCHHPTASSHASSLLSSILLPPFHRLRYLSILVTTPTPTPFSSLIPHAIRTPFHHPAIVTTHTFAIIALTSFPTGHPAFSPS